jgi:carboxyl-terminal processing protease
LEEVSYSDAISIIRGPIGVPVILSIERKAERAAGQLVMIDVPLVRDKVHTPSISFEMGDDGIAYIHFKKFRLDSSQELAEVIAELPDSTRSIVIDLRGNPGGLLSEAVNSVDLFVSEGTIVTTRGRGGVLLETFSADPETITSLPLVVLIDEFSASASEIFAGAIQDFDRGEVVGNTSYGKGSVQAIYELPNDSAMKLTIARYHLPNGRAIETAGGVTPDILVVPPTDSGQVRVRFRDPLHERLPIDPQLSEAFNVALGLAEQ